MTIQALFNKGCKDCGMLEKIADGILAFPRALWQGRSVEIVTNKENFDITIEKVDALIKDNIDWYDNFPMGIISGAIGAVLLLVVVSPFLAVGLPLKKIALKGDEKANAYNKYAEAILNQHTLGEDIKKLKNSVRKLKLNKVAKLIIKLNK